MKTNIFRLVSLFLAILLVGGGVCAAQPTATAQPLRQGNPKFDLDFPGGTPAQLVAAVEKATGESLNAIIPEQDKDVMLPSIKVRQVTADDLFIAMEQSSHQTELQVSGTLFSGFSSGPQYSQVETSYGFRKVGSLWVFTNKKAKLPPDRVMAKTRFYQLEPYLGQHTVEDITTAIQTAWKMMAENKMPQNKNAATELKFHKETGLLIAVGDITQVQVIDDVLSALRPDLVIKPKTSEAPAKTNAPAKN